MLRFVHISTAALYFTADAKDGFGAASKQAAHHLTPVPEWTALPPAYRQPNEFCETRYQAEAVVQQAQLSGELCTVTLRPRGLFGPGDPTLAPRLLPYALSGRLRIPGEGDACVDLTYIDNAAHAVELALHAPAATVEGRTYNLSNDEPVRLWAAVARLCERIGVTPPSRSVPMRLLRALVWLLELGQLALSRLRCVSAEAEPPLTAFALHAVGRSSLVDTAAARRDLGYEPIVSMSEAIERTADAYLAANPTATAAAAAGPAAGPASGTAAATTPRARDAPAAPAVASSAAASAAASDPLAAVAAGVAPSAACVAVHACATLWPSRPAVISADVTVYSLVYRRMHLAAHLLGAVFAVLLDVLFLLFEHSAPIRVSPSTLYDRLCDRGLSLTATLMLLALLARCVSHPCRKPTHGLVLKAPWRACTYAQLAARVAQYASRQPRPCCSRTLAAAAPSPPPHLAAAAEALTASPAAASPAAASPLTPSPCSCSQVRGRSARRRPHQGQVTRADCLPSAAC